MLDTVFTKPDKGVAFANNFELQFSSTNRKYVDELDGDGS